MSAERLTVGKTGGDPLRIELANMAIDASGAGDTVGVEREGSQFKCAVLRVQNGQPVPAGPNGEVYATSFGGDVFVAAPAGEGYKATRMLDPAKPGEDVFLASLLDYASRVAEAGEGVFLPETEREVPDSDKKKAKILADFVECAKRSGATLPVSAVINGRKIPPMDCFVLLPELRPAGDRPGQPMFVALNTGRVAAVKRGRYGYEFVAVSPRSETNPFINEAIETAQGNLAAFNGDHHLYKTWATWPQNSYLANNTVLHLRHD